MVTDRHESEDVTPVSSRVMKAKVSALDADGRDPSGIFLTGWTPEENKQLCFRPPRLHARS